MKFDRGMIKWQPFDSVVSSKETLKKITLEKAKITKPILSEEEITDIEEKLIEAYYCQIDVTIKYYQGGYLKTTKGKIQKIDQISKMIYLNSLSLLFNQIVAINY